MNISDRQKRRIALAAWRLPTSFLRTLPDFLCLGAQRSGTSTLNTYFSRHPQIRDPLRKEVHFFDKNYHKGFAWYRAHMPFRDRSGKTITGESSPFYLFHPHCPERIARDLPDAKFIVLLRNPVRRAISHYWKQYTSGFETLDIEAAIDAEEERITASWNRFAAGEVKRPFEFQKFSYLSRGRYAEQLERYFSLIDRERFLVMQSEAFWREPASHMDMVCEFLGIEPIGDRLKPARRGAMRPSSEVPARVIERLETHFEPYNRQLFELLGEEWDW